jgi:glycosyltransferase involved in cell wall biosynthesis
MMRDAGWSIERIRTLAKAGAFPELTRDPIDHALATALPETADRPKEAVAARGADAADYSGDLLGMADRYARFVVDATRGLDFDVIHAHDWLTYPAGLALQKLTGKPLLVHVHSTEFDRSGEHPHQQIYNIERRGMHGATRAIAVSMLTKNVCVNRYGVNASKIDVVYNGVDLNPADVGVQPIHSKDKIVLYFGRITMQKGPEYFIQAAKKVLEYMDNVKFVVAGSGDQAQRMIEMAAAMGIGNKVLFTGFLRGKDIQKVFSIADLYVMPSVSEPFGIAPLEAMGNRVPVIISRTSGVGEILTNVLKCDFWDVDDMANKIVAVLRHPPLQRTLRDSGYFEVRGITWDGAAAKVDAVYERAMAAVNRR